jgi:hypothetical protein
MDNINPICFDYSANLGQAICAFTLRNWLRNGDLLSACEMRLCSLELKNLNLRSENPFAYFEESLRTITKVFTHKLNQSQAKKKYLHRIPNRATKKMLRARVFCI